MGPDMKVMQALPGMILESARQAVGASLEVRDAWSRPAVWTSGRLVLRQGEGS